MKRALTIKRQNYNVKKKIKIVQTICKHFKLEVLEKKEPSLQIRTRKVSKQKIAIFIFNPGVESTC